METKTKQTYLNKIMTAITFAEAGDHETAKGVLEQANTRCHRLDTRVEKRKAMEL
ncbi:MAG: hypothetical protein KJ990_09785 [Proteobacteria bacterium]|nr:hypothetical protein [Pseudomonadota bacterium]MBU1649253.1 hypothetical protein [Pseudomonadota bacterium]